MFGDLFQRVDAEFWIGRDTTLYLVTITLVTPNDRSRGESCVDLVRLVIYEVREMEMELVGIQRILTRGKQNRGGGGYEITDIRHDPDLPEIIEEEN